MRINDTWIVIGSAAVRSGLWILIGPAALRIVVGGFLIRTAGKVVTHCAVFFYFLKGTFFVLVAAVHSLLGVVMCSIEFALQLTYNLGTLQFSLVHSFLPVGFL